MIKIGVHGASGKMGREIIACLKGVQNATLSAAYALDEIDFALPSGAIFTNKFEELFVNSDVIIDFTIKQGQEGMALVAQAANAMPVLQATNMSLGVAVLNKLAAIAAKALREFDVEIVEQHHRHKKDAPSGTALTLAERIADARGLNLSEAMTCGREGLIGARPKDEIAVFAMRGGDVVGRHTAGFYNDGEFIELSHTATSRATFAKGAIKAAMWLVGQPSGLYKIEDCLGL